MHMWTSFNLLRTSIEQRGRGKMNLLSLLELGHPSSSSLTGSPDSHILIICNIYIIRTGSHNYGVQKVPQSAVYKLENKKSWWYNLVGVQRPESQGSQSMRAGEDWCPSSSKESQFIFPLPFCSIEAFSVLEDVYLRWWGPFLTQSTNSNANLFQKQPHRHTQKCLTSYLGIP